MTKKSMTQQQRQARILTRFKVDVQYIIGKTMKEKSVTRTELARRLGVSQARVTAMLSDDANLELDTIARVFDALEDAPYFSSNYLEKNKDSLRYTPNGPMPLGWNDVKKSNHDSSGSADRESVGSADLVEVMGMVAKDTSAFDRIELETMAPWQAVKPDSIIQVMNILKDKIQITEANENKKTSKAAA